MSYLSEASVGRRQNGNREILLSTIGRERREVRGSGWWESCQSLQLPVRGEESVEGLRRAAPWLLDLIGQWRRSRACRWLIYWITPPACTVWTRERQRLLHPDTKTNEFHWSFVVYSFSFSFCAQKQFHTIAVLLQIVAFWGLRAKTIQYCCQLLKSYFGQKNRKPHVYTTYSKMYYLPIESPTLNDQLSCTYRGCGFITRLSRHTRWWRFPLKGPCPEFIGLHRAVYKILKVAM